MTHIGRATASEITELETGMDFRRPEFRREVFHRFYEFHLRYKSHPGAVYYVMPFLAEHFNWDDEAKLWFAFVNGNTQNPVTSLRVVTEFPTPGSASSVALDSWFRKNYASLAFDTDRRYFKKRLPEAVARYQQALAGGTQRAFYMRFAGDGSEGHFRNLWAFLASGGFAYFGRLSAFSFLEYLRIMGLPITCDSLFLDDLQGSKSHRNGLCKVLGRDDLDWHDSNPSFPGYTAREIAWLYEEGEQLLAEAQARALGKPWARDAGYFTLESALCTYKSWHRPNRRYPNVYNDLFFERIRAAEKLGVDCSVFWTARRACLPEHLRLEDCPGDPGCVPVKQNHYLKTGQVIMMDREWSCFRNDFNDHVRRLP